MSDTNLFDLLPAVIRTRDANQGGALQSLFAILQDTHDALDQDIANLYENWFIETCAEWAVPYIGALLGATPLNAADIAGVSTRAYVAHTLSYRRRKGTAVVLNQLARDVTNWPANAVEFFQLIAATQYVNHTRPENLGSPDLRRTADLQLLGGPFDPWSRSVDVRGIMGPPIDPSLGAGSASDPAPLRGKYNIPNIGLFLWRLKGYAIEGVTPAVVADGANTRYRFHPAGIDQPLYNQPSDPAAAFTPVAGEAQVPGALRRLALYQELEARRQAMVDANQVWLADTAFPLGADIVDTSGNTQRVVAASGAGLTGATTPDWPAALGATIADGDLGWQTVGIGSALPAVYFDAQPVLQVFPEAGGAAIPPEQLMICDLSNLAPPAPPGAWRTPVWSQTYIRASDGAKITLPLRALVDPQAGRLILRAAPAGPEAVRVSSSYAFSGDLGGGPYDRTASLAAMLAGVDTASSGFWQVAVSRTLAPVGGVIFATVAAAVAAWNALPAASPRFGVIAALDNASYGEALAIEIPEAATLLLVSADWPSLAAGGQFGSYQLSAVGRRAFLGGAVTVKGGAPAGSEDPGAALLSGFLMQGPLTLLQGNLGALTLADCTLTPATGTLAVAPAIAGKSEIAGLTITLQRTILGPISLPPGDASGCSLAVTDSIIDAGAGVAIAAGGADANIASSTIIGAIGAAQQSGLRSLQASDAIFTAPVFVERTQGGCLRYSVLPSDASKVPRRFRCQPDLALAGANVSDAAAAAIREQMTPAFTSLAYGDPGYAQLSDDCAREIRAGADDGSEMGAFDFLKQPQRDSNLRSVIPEYLRFGMQAGIFYVN